MAGTVLGLVRRVLRDPAQSEEVAQEVLIEVWRSAARFDARQGSGMSWIMTLTHRRAVDRVRSAQAAADREHKAGVVACTAPFDEVSEQVERRLERAQVRRPTTAGTPTGRPPSCWVLPWEPSRHDCGTG